MQFLRVNPSTEDNSKIWKLWHGVNIFIAGWCFLIGSIAMFPIFTSYVYAALCGWLFTIGSTCFLIADLTEWIYFLEQDFRFLSYAINFFVNVVGSALYLVGSILFIPEAMHFYEGVHYFIAGALLVMIAQIWKLVRAFGHPSKSVIEIFKEDSLTVILDFLAACGALLYFIGSFIFQKSVGSEYYTTMGVLIFCLGAGANCTSSILIFYRYFYTSQTSLQPLIQRSQRYLGIQICRNK